MSVGSVCLLPGLGRDILCLETSGYFSSVTKLDCWLSTLSSNVADDF